MTSTMTSFLLTSHDYYLDTNATLMTNLTSFPCNDSTLTKVFERHGGETELLFAYRPAISVIDKYVTPLWYVVGFPGNLLAFAVWIQRRMRPSSGFYLAALALDDFIFLIMHLIFELQMVWGRTVWHMPVWCELFPILFYSSQYLSPFLVLAFTVERYISVCHPFQREKYCTTRRAVFVTASLIVFSVSLNLIQGYFWTYENGICGVREAVTNNNDKGSLFSIWSWVTELLVFGVVPLVILGLNVLVIKEMHRISKRLSRLASNNAASSEQRMSRERTVMLLSVSLYLIFSTLPVTICFAIYYLFPSGNECLTNEQLIHDTKWQRYFSYWNARTLIQELGMSHYACNFVIYFLTGKVFRRELWITLQQTLCGRRINRCDYSGPESINLTVSGSADGGKSHGGKSVQLLTKLKNGDTPRNGNVVKPI